MQNKLKNMKIQLEKESLKQGIKVTTFHKIPFKWIPKEERRKRKFIFNDDK